MVGRKLLEFKRSIAERWQRRDAGWSSCCTGAGMLTCPRAGSIARVPSHCCHLLGRTRSFSPRFLHSDTFMEERGTPLGGHRCHCGVRDPCGGEQTLSTQPRGLWGSPKSPSWPPKCWQHSSDSALASLDNPHVLWQWFYAEMNSPVMATSTGCTESIWKEGILNVDAQKKRI